MFLHGLADAVDWSIQFIFKVDSGLSSANHARLWNYVTHWIYRPKNPKFESNCFSVLGIQGLHMSHIVLIHWCSVHLG